MSPALISTVLAVAAGATSGGVEWEVGAAGGYESNLTLAAAGRPGVDSGVATASAGAGLTSSLSEGTRLYVGGRYQGAAYLDAEDLSRNALTATLLLSHELADRVAVVLIPDLGYAWYGNSARDGPVFVGKALLRIRGPSVTFRTGYARLERSAADSAYSIRANRFLASAEVRAAPGTRLSLAYSLQLGSQVFYRAVGLSSVVPGPMGPGTGGEGAHGGSGAFASLEPYRATATQSSLSPRWEQRVWRSLHLSVAYDFSWGSTGGETFTAHALYAGATYRN